MTVSIPLLAIMAIAVYVVYRYMGLKVWHAVLCLIVGFLLASSGAARSTACLPASSTRRRSGSLAERLMGDD